MPANNILVFVDHPTPEAHFWPYDIRNVFPVHRLLAEVAVRGPFPNAVAVVGGHGDETGLSSGGARVLGPTKLVESLRAVPGIALGVLVLTQCYAGVFNFLDTRNQPPLVILGGTNLNPSVSLTLNLALAIPLADSSPGLQAWIANIFSYHFFSWLRSPKDIDGDGEINLIDAYKFSGSVSNSHLRNAKGPLFLRVQQLSERFKEVQNLPANFPPRKLMLDSVEVELRQALDMLYLHQEPWILNAHLARDVCFK